MHLVVVVVTTADLAPSFIAPSSFIIDSSSHSKVITVDWVESVAVANSFKLALNLFTIIDQSTAKIDSITSTMEASSFIIIDFVISFIDPSCFTVVIGRAFENYS